MDKHWIFSEISHVEELSFNEYIEKGQGHTEAACRGIYGNRRKRHHVGDHRGMVCP